METLFSLSGVPAFMEQWCGRRLQSAVLFYAYLLVCVILVLSLTSQYDPTVLAMHIINALNNEFQSPDLHLTHLLKSFT
jgi:hypothetical protein